MFYKLLISFMLISLFSFAGSPSRILVHGHRGARARMPENTLPAFEYAIQQGVDALEMDMAVTKDNVIVISHDPILETPVCSGPRNGVVIHTLTLAEVRQWDCGAVQNPNFHTQQTVPGTRMPTLDDVLQLATRGTFDYNIETKSFPERPEYTPPPNEFARLVLDKVRQYKLEKRVILQSFDFRTLVAMRQLAPEIRLSALTEMDPRAFTTIAKEAANAEIVSPYYKLVTAEKVAAAHALNIQVVPWTVNDPAEWDRLIEARVDAIISDDPAALIAHLKKRGLR
jgi:glycerophosphoryl diester phosphodiesterase